MDNRMRSNMMRGRSVVKDSAIQSLFTQLTKKHAEVLTRMSKLDSERGTFFHSDSPLIFDFRILRGPTGPLELHTGSSASFD